MGIGMDELGLAARNHGMPLEMLREPLTPTGLHYLLVHFDIPELPDWRLDVGARTFTLDELRSRERRTVAVTLECAGNGRALLERHEPSQPWLHEAVGTAEWTGTPLAPLLRETGLAEGAVEVVFTGADRGLQGGVEHAYARSLPVEEALRDDVLLADEMNGAPLLPQHGAPLRLVVPGWYGMTHVKWLTSIHAVDREFDGWQQADAYRLDDGTPVQRIEPRALMIPPGIPDFLSRERVAEPGRHLLRGRAWSGYGPVERVEVAVDGDWRDAELEPPLGPYAWRGWTCVWDAEPGEHELRCRATDATGRTQPDAAAWNHGGYCNNAPQIVRVKV